MALAWANSPWRASYEALWHTPIGLRVGRLAFERDLHFWINDGLMVVFFFVVGSRDPPRDPRGRAQRAARAALPLIAALGGMVVPALHLPAVQRGARPALAAGASRWRPTSPSRSACWRCSASGSAGAAHPAARAGGDRRPRRDHRHRALLLVRHQPAGSRSCSPPASAACSRMQKLGVRSPWAYLLPALVIWGGAYAAGVHPTLAGVVARPAHARRAPGSGPATSPTTRSAHVEAYAQTSAAGDSAADVARSLSSNVRRPGGGLAGRAPAARASRLGGLRDHAALRPGQCRRRAGRARASTAAAWRSSLGVGCSGWSLGKPLGIVAFSWLAVRTRVGRAARRRRLARRAAWSGLWRASASRWRSSSPTLAFPPGPLIEVAKLGILCGSALAATLGLMAGRLNIVAPATRRRRPHRGRGRGLDPELRASRFGFGRSVEGLRCSNLAEDSTGVLIITKAGKLSVANVPHLADGEDDLLAGGRNRPLCRRYLADIILTSGPRQGVRR